MYLVFHIPPWTSIGTLSRHYSSTALVPILATLFLWVTLTCDSPDNVNCGLPDTMLASSMARGALHDPCPHAYIVHIRSCQGGVSGVFCLVDAISACYERQLACDFRHLVTRSGVGVPRTCVERHRHIAQIHIPPSLVVLLDIHNSYRQ